MFLLLECLYVEFLIVFEELSKYLASPVSLYLSHAVLRLVPLVRVRSS